MEDKNANRLEELNVTNEGMVVGRGYSRFVKSMRFILPLMALGLMVVIITWPRMDDKIMVVEKKDILPESVDDIGQNELLNPRFQTTDAQANPVNVTAKRALQNQENPNLITLDTPKADLKMKDGSAVNVDALNGTYEQETEKLFLQNQVKIRHESGYELRAEELRVDMKTREAFSDKDVEVEGPDGKIKATGLEGNVEDGILIFKGPATLTLSPNQKSPAPIEKDLQ